MWCHKIIEFNWNITASVRKCKFQDTTILETCESKTEEYAKFYNPEAEAQMS